jgi:ATP-dependent protease HslVU (ClpYQ) peptidase subunit
MAVDKAGNLYIGGDYVVRKVTPSGIISTVAGRGPSAQVFGYGFSGDGGPATAAQLNDNLRVAVDGAGNLFIVDWANQRVRKVSPNGIIATVAGSGTTLAPGMRGGNQSTLSGFLEGGFGGDGGPGTAASLRWPTSITTDGAGNVYVLDSGNRRIRKLSPGGVISTVAGNGDTGESADGVPATRGGIGGATTIAADSAGNLFIASGVSHIRKVTTDGVISTIPIRTAGPSRPAPRLAARGPIVLAAGFATFSLVIAASMRKFGGNSGTGNSGTDPN